MKRKEIRMQKNMKSYAKALAGFLLLIIVTMSVFFYSVAKNIEENVASSLYYNVERQSYHFTTILENQYAYLTGLAQYIGGKDSLISAENIELVKDIGEKSSLERIGIITDGGEVNYDSGEIKSVADREYFQKIMQGENVLSNPLESKIDGQTRVILGVPIYRNGKVAGGLAGSYNVSELGYMLFKDVYGGTGFSMIVSHDGTMISVSGDTDNYKITLEDNFFDYHKQKEFLSGSIEAVCGDFETQRSGYVKLGQGEDIRYLQYVPIGYNNWMLCYAVPVSKANEAYDTLKHFEVLLAAVLALLMLGLLFTISRINGKKERLLLKYAQTDSLTGVLNKQSTQDSIDDWLCSRECTGLQAFFMMDVDYFKEVNDVYGHVAGDEVLHRFGRMLRKEFRDTDIVGRIGGDEFVVLMINISSRDAAAAKAEKLSKVLQSMDIPQLDGHKITCSIGISFYPDHGEEYEQLYGCADKALYETKKRGRNGMSIYQY